MTEINPKEEQGNKKLGISVVPAQVIFDVAKALNEGASKYGAYNFRATELKSSVYYNSTMRHMMAWWEGQDIDPDSGLHHITKAIAGLIVFRDSMLNGFYEDDRPPTVKDVGFLDTIKDV